MKNLASSIGSKISALSAGIGKNQYIQALTAGMMAIMPITLGTAAFAILANLPFEGWQNFIINTGLHAHFFYTLGAYNNINPLVAMPWIMPAPISAFFVGGPFQMIAIICAILGIGVLYYPFFKMADKQALAEEKANAAQVEVETVEAENAKSTKTKLRTN